MRAGRASGWLDGGGGDPDGVGFPRLTSAVKVLLWVNIGVFLLNFVLGGALSQYLSISPQDMAANPLFGALRLVTHQFVHAYDSPFHILFNMLMFYFLGTMLEGSIGPRKLVWLYLVSGVMGGVAWLVFCWISGQNLHMVGASGSVYGILVYAACLHPRLEVFLLVFRMRLWVLAAILVGIALYMTVYEVRAGRIGGVANAGHIGGAAYGFAAFRLARAGGIAGRIRGRFADLARVRQRAAGHRLDTILEKIKRSGMTSLTFLERRFLVRQSRRRGPR